MAKYARPKGTEDVLPGQADPHQAIERLVAQIFSKYHYQEMRTPIFEYTEVFERGVGETTDIVAKEMYTFTDRGGRSLTLRPEGTAGVVRAFVEGKLFGGPMPVKAYYVGPMFRQEKPQAGRLRQLHQYGVEILGSDDPRADAEVIEVGDRVLREAGVTGFRLELNSVGCPVCRANHKKLLVEHLRPALPELCEDCRARYERNPLRILDCKVDGHHPVVVSAPTITDHLCADCETHFAAVKRALDDLEVNYEVNPRLVRGLDYYTRTAFEFIEGRIGAQSTVLGGGRYNGLVQTLGGPDVAGIGFAGGIERLILAQNAAGMERALNDSVDVFVIGLGEAGEREAVRVLRDLRAAGLAADTDYAGRSLKSQLKAADRLQAAVTLLIGEDEAARQEVAVRSMKTKEQTAVSAAAVVAYVKQLIERERVDHRAAHA